MRILIAPDKFKGTLTAQEAAAAIARGWRRARSQDRLELLPMSDGGDGFGEVIGVSLSAKKQTTRTVDAARRPCKAEWWWESKTKTAIIESAKVIGLAMLPAGKFHPFDLDTFGLGKVVRAAQAKGAKEILIGIGGSATNDGAFGMARALGWEFLAKDGRCIERWTDLALLVRIRKPHGHKAPKVVVAVDVQNPLLGKRGASRIYGPQKGLRVKDFAVAELCLRRLASVAKQEFGKDFARTPGAGAAGGLGFGLLAFCGATFVPGFDLVAKQTRLVSHLRASDLVVTGEGAIDDSTAMGKGTGQLALMCRRFKTPCIGLAGNAKRDRATARLFVQLGALTDLTTVAQAKAKPAFWLERLAEKVARGQP